MTCSTRGTKVCRVWSSRWASRSACDGTWALQRLLHLLGLLHDLLRQGEQLLIAGLHVLGGLLAAPAGRINELLGHAPDAAGAIAEHAAGCGDGRLEQRFGALNRAREHADPVGEQRTIDGIMDVRGDDGAIQAQLAAAGDVLLTGQGDDVIEQPLEGRRLNEVGPAQQRGIVGHARRVDAAELAQDEAVADPLLGLFVAPVIQVLDDQQAQDDLDGRGGPAEGGRARIAASKIGFDGLEELIVVEQGVELGEHGIGLHAQGGNMIKQIDRVVPVAQHGAPPPLKVPAEARPRPENCKPFPERKSQYHRTFAPKTSTTVVIMLLYADVAVSCRRIVMHEIDASPPALDPLDVQVWSQYWVEIERRIGSVFARSETRSRAMAYLAGLLSPAERKNSWQLAEITGDPTPYGFQHLLGRADWDPDVLRDRLRTYVTDYLAAPDSVGVSTKPAFSRKGATPPAWRANIAAPLAASRTARSASC